MKKLTYVFIILSLCLCAFMLISCGGNDETTITEAPPVEPNPLSEGLAFEMNSDGKSYAVVGIGECKDTVIHIPDEYNDLPVTSIGRMAFENNKQITHIYIPNSVTYIDVEAFFGCSYLTTIVIPDTVTYIGIGAFVGCRSLTDINLPANLTSISKNLFASCGIESITIPDSVTSIGGTAFKESKIKSVNIPNGVTSIERGVFTGCEELTSVTIPSSVTSIDSHAFGGCKKLESIIIPSSVTHISKNAFYGNENLTVYCEAESKPDGWDDEWTGDERKDIKVKEVIWGYKEN